jgi:FkbM family methyltransferase
MKISNKIHEISFRFNPMIYVVYFFLINLYFKFPIQLKLKKGQILVTDNTTNYMIYNSRPRRIQRYYRGVKSVCDSILDSYHVREIDISKAGVIIDVGANVGEFSYALKKLNSNLNIIAIEPDPKEFRDLSLNIKSSPNKKTIQAAVSNLTGNGLMYTNNDFGDTSFFKTTGASQTFTVEISTLDEIFFKYVMPQKILICKVEAEGMEPEVLLGAKHALANTIYLCCDTSPERLGKSTFEESKKILTESNFYLVKGDQNRSLWINKSLKN